MSTEMIHGGNVEQFARKFGFAPEDVLDFSSNTNPLPLPEAIKEQYAASFNTLQRYPDLEYYELSAALSSYTGYSREWIMIGNGATELIYLAVRSIKPGKVLLAAPSFTDYERGFRLAGGRVELYRLREEFEFKLDIEEFLEKMREGYEMTVLCNPNNPTGYLIPKQDLLFICDEAKKQGTLVLIDETFIEFAPEAETASLLREISTYDNVLILRALTKFFGVPGLRLGYCVAHPDLLQKMAIFKEPWTVNALASVLGVSLLKNEDFIRRTKKWIAEERPYFFRGLCSIKGLLVFPSSANFFLVKLLKSDWHARMLQSELLSDMILIRDASSFTFLDNRFIRLAVKERADNDRLLGALQYYY